MDSSPSFLRSPSSPSALTEPSAEASATTPRSAAVAMLRRAASTRESPSNREASPSPRSSHALGPPSLDPSASPDRPQTTSDDTSLFLSSPGATPLERTASLLARSTALAKLTGAAPPTPPPSFYSPPLGGAGFAPSERLPSLEDLRERAAARLRAVKEGPPPKALRRNHTVTGVGGAAREGGFGGAGLGLGLGLPVAEAVDEDEDKPIQMDRAEARVNLMRKLSSRRLEGPSAPSGASPGSPSSSPERTRDPAVTRRARARPRSGSAGSLDWRLGAKEGEDEVPEVPALPSDIINLPALDPASPSSPSSPPPRPSLDAPSDSTRSATSMSGRSSGVWRAERDRESLIARQSGGDKPWEFENVSEGAEETLRTSQQLSLPTLDPSIQQDEHEQDHEEDWEMITPRPPKETASTEGRFATPHESPLRVDARGVEPQSSDSAFVFDPRAAAARAVAAAAASASAHRPVEAALANRPVPIILRRGSIPEHVRPPGRATNPAIIAGPGGSAIATTSLGLPAPSAHRQPPPPSFGIRAVEEHSDDDVRRRGSSASSSVAFLDGRRTRGSGSVVGRNDSVASEMMLGLGVGLRSDYGSVSAPATPASERENPMASARAGMQMSKDDDLETVAGEDNASWSTRMREQRLSAKVEKKREAGLARSKEGAFPPPEEGYQFPSPTIGSPRDSMDDPSQANSLIQDPKGLFDKLGSPRSRNRTSPFLPAPDSPFLPTYAPRSVPGGPALPITSSPNLPREPVSPTSTGPDDLSYQHLGTSPPLASSFAPASAALERTASAESNSKKWFNTALFKPKGASPRTSGAAEMQRQDSNRSTRSTLGGSRSGARAEYVDASEESVHSGDSNYSSSTEMRRDFSASSIDSFLPIQPRHHPFSAQELPSNKILARLDSLLAPPQQSEAPSALDNPPRKLLLHTPVLQVVNAHTVKDRHLFLFTDLLLITKPLIEDDPVTGAPLPVTLETSFLVKSVVELDHLHVLAASDPVEHRERDQKRHPLLLTFIDRFANDPKKAIGALIQRGNLSNDAQTIAHLIFKNPELNRNQVGAYFADPSNRHILRAYIERFRFAGVRIDDALRMFLMSLRLPHNVEAAEYVLGVVAMQWIETNGGCGFDPSLTLSLILAIMRLSDALHSGANGNDGTFSMPNPTLSVDDFIASFRELDPRLLVPEDLLTRIYASVRRERIEQASDNSIFSMTPDIEASMIPARLPISLTYRAQSDPITISIPEPDPKFSIKLHGTDLKFDPPVLSFAKSSTQTFRVTGTALGPKAMVLIKVGANAPRYQGLPLNKVFSIERAFMQHTFQVSFTNHLDVKRKYMFSTLDPSVRSTWLRVVRERTTACLQRPPASTAALQAAEAVAVQVLRDSLIQPEDTIPVTPSAAPSPRPNTAAPKFGSSTAVPPPSRSRLNTPTRAGQGALVRSNSFSKTYAHNFKVEADLAPDSRKTGQSSSALMFSSGVATPTRRGSKDDSAALAALVKNPYTKKGSDIVLTTEQNSLLPLVLSFLGAGLPAAPLPVSSQGSAFQLPPLVPKQGEALPTFSFVSPTSSYP